MKLKVCMCWFADWVYLRKELEYNGAVHQLFIYFKKACVSVWREVLYNILTGVGIPMKVIRVIKMCLDESCMYSFGYFPGVWLLYADVSQHCICSIFIGWIWSTKLLHTSYPAYEDGTDRVFRNVGIQQSDVGEIPKRIHTIFKTRRKFEFKNRAIIDSSLSDFFLMFSIPKCYNI